MLSRHLIEVERYLGKLLHSWDADVAHYAVPAVSCGLQRRRILLGGIKKSVSGDVQKHQNICGSNHRYDGGLR